MVFYSLTAGAPRLFNIPIAHHLDAMHSRSRTCAASEAPGAALAHCGLDEGRHIEAGATTLAA